MAILKKILGRIKKTEEKKPEGRSRTSNEVQIFKDVPLDSLHQEDFENVNEFKEALNNKLYYVKKELDDKNSEMTRIIIRNDEHLPEIEDLEMDAQTLNTEKKALIKKINEHESRFKAVPQEDFENVKNYTKFKIALNNNLHSVEKKLEDKNLEMTRIIIRNEEDSPEMDAQTLYTEKKALIKKINEHESRFKAVPLDSLHQEDSENVKNYNKLKRALNNDLHSVEKKLEDKNLVLYKRELKRDDLRELKNLEIDTGRLIIEKTALIKKINEHKSRSPIVKGKRDKTINSIKRR